MALVFSKYFCVCQNMPLYLKLNSTLSQAKISFGKNTFWGDKMLKIQPPAQSKLRFQIQILKK